MGKAFIAAGGIIAMLFLIILVSVSFIDRGGGLIYDTDYDINWGGWRMSNANYIRSSTSDSNYNITGIEIRHLYHVKPEISAGGLPASTGPFITALGTKHWFRPLPNSCFFSVDSDLQELSSADQTLDNWAKRDGDVSPLPFPDQATIVLLTAGLIGFLGLRRRFKKKESNRRRP